MLDEEEDEVMKCLEFTPPLRAGCQQDQLIATACNIYTLNISSFVNETILPCPRPHSRFKNIY